MFFEALRFGCRKKTCDVKKVTNNMYQCYLCVMSREMMERNDRDSAECQNWEYKG